MKAIVVRQPGGLDAMRLESIPAPVAGPKDVVIKVEACGVCFHDVLTRNGTLKAGVKIECGNPEALLILAAAAAAGITAGVAFNGSTAAPASGPTPGVTVFNGPASASR